MSRRAPWKPPENDTSEAELPEAKVSSDVTHVVAPGCKATPWCRAVPGDSQGSRETIFDESSVTDRGVVGCESCIEMLFEHPQYYNTLRAQGLRTLHEAEWEKAGGRYGA